MNDSWPGVQAGLAVVDGILFIMSGISSFISTRQDYQQDDQMVDAFDARTGDFLWQTKCRRHVALFDTPTFVNGKACIHTRWGQISAFELQTGKEQWNVQTGREWPSLTHFDGIVYIGDEDNWIIALDACTGRERWRFQSSDYPYIVTIAGGVAYVSTDAVLYALDTTDGSERWRLT